MRDRIDNKYENQASKLGYLIGFGLLNSGGGNSVFKLLTNEGHMKIKNIIGTYMFTFYWYWYPLVNMLGLALEPTYIAGVVDTLKVPRSLKIQCNAPKKFFSYFKTEVVVKDVEKNKLAVLSTTKRVRARNGESKI